MSSLRAIRAVCVGVVCTLFAVMSLTAQAGAASGGGYLADQENAMVALVNRHRTAMGLKPLRTDPALRAVARRQTDRMVAAGQIFHNPNLAREAGGAVTSWLAIGENVGVGPTTDAVEETFLDSAHHRENIEGDYNEFAIGAEPGANGVTYFTQNFAKTGALPPTTARRAASGMSPATTSTTSTSVPAPPTTEPLAPPAPAADVSPMPVLEHTTAASPHARQRLTMWHVLNSTLKKAVLRLL